jgi:hypothetical protein
MTAVLTRETVTASPATLFGCIWAVLPPGVLAAVLPLADAGSWHGVRLTGDGRLISGTAWPSGAQAARWVEDDRGVLLDAEQDHYRRTGMAPGPMTPVLADAPVVGPGRK